MTNLNEAIFQIVAAIIFAGAITFLALMYQTGNSINYTTDMNSRQRKEIVEGYDSTVDKAVLETKEEVYYDILTTVKQEDPLKTGFYIEDINGNQREEVTGEMITQIVKTGKSASLVSKIDEKSDGGKYKFEKIYNVADNNKEFNAVIYKAYTETTE